MGSILGNFECSSMCPCSETIKNLEFWGLSFRNLQIISGLPTPVGSRLTRLAGWGAVIGQLSPHKSIPVPHKTSSGETWLQHNRLQCTWGSGQIQHVNRPFIFLQNSCWTLVGPKAFCMEFCRSWVMLLDFWKALDHSWTSDPQYSPLILKFHNTAWAYMYLPEICWSNLFSNSPSPEKHYLAISNYELHLLAVCQEHPIIDFLHFNEQTLYTGPERYKQFTEINKLN